MAKAPRDCPCCSGMRYAACCAPVHRGEREAPSPELLMRSRYAAFALGLGEYLVRTLAAGHPDRDLPRASLVRELSRAHERQRFMGLRILHAAPSEVTREQSPGAHASEAARLSLCLDGEIMFYARIFERGADRSFVELSQFEREGDAWRYASGIVLATADLPADVETLLPDDLRARRG